MSKSQPTPQRFSWVKRDIIFPFVLLIIVVVFAVWHGQRDNNSSTATSVPAGWSQYKADKYGFEFNHPSTWGDPVVGVTKGKTGSLYLVNFKPSPGAKAVNSKSSVSISMYSKDYVNALCSQVACPAQKSLDSQTIQASIKAGAKTFIKYDATSYAMLNSNLLTHTSSLTDEQIVELPKINVGGIIGVSTLSGTNTCPQDKFAPSTQSGCIGPGDYDTLNQVLKSFKAI